ncbi:MAG: ABC transporter ATP-binding protein [Caldilineaceae bacterium]|nr:ABC transporter ATP-binding protein [Caldilineaceae bacterium]
MKSLRRAFRYIKPYKWYAIIGLLTVIIPVAMELIVPWLLRFVIDQGIRPQNMAVIARYAGFMLLAALVGSIATLGQGVCRAQISQGVAFDARNELFRHIQSLSWPDLDRLRTGQLMTRISSDVNILRMFLSASIALLLRALLMVFGSVILMATIDLPLTAVIVVALLMAGAVIAFVMTRAQPIFMQVQQRLSRINTLVQENLAGVRVVKAYVREPYEMEQFDAANREYMAANVRVGRLMAVIMPMLMVLTGLGSVAIIWQGGLDTISGRLSVGELVAFNSYLMIGMAPLMLLGNVLMMVSRAEASAERIEEVLNVEPRIQRAPDALTADSLQGRVDFRDVSFAYETASDQEETIVNAPRPQLPVGANGYHNGNGVPPANGVRNESVLRGITFSVEPGQRVAIVGATGSGKSSLIHMLPRFYDADDGTIRIDDVDVRQWAPDVLRRNIGLVLQESTIFQGTVRENIAYGRPDAAMDEVIQAAKAAQAHDFIMAMPEQYESRVEAMGTNLSGGQKQRIAIARALVTDPAILALDDCTSAVDMETEFLIQEALDELMAGRTTFIVAQRISSVLNADQIFVLDQGRIAAAGSHHELLETSPIYREIVASQIGVDDAELGQMGGDNQ